MAILLVWVNHSVIMFARVHCPEALRPEELDAYLEKGWFRMGQTIFTTNFLNFKDQYYSAIWLRVVLSDLSPDRTYAKLMKLNAGLRTEIQAVTSISPEKETLFTKYRECVTFEASSSLRQLLYGKSQLNIYDTHEVNIYDGEKLIATGIFDIGMTSAAGITCIYDPAYRKFSLGKYLIYLKMDYCKKLALQYFYPGYFVPGYDFFDYKLSIGKSALQFFRLSSEQWLPIAEFSQKLSPYQLMEDKLRTLQTLLRGSKVETRLLRYEFFDANLIPDLREVELFDFPLFLFFSESQEGNFNRVIVFNVRDQYYHLVTCRSVWKSGPLENRAEVYSSNLLKAEEDEFLAQKPAETVAIILKR